MCRAGMPLQLHQLHVVIASSVRHLRQHLQRGYTGMGKGELEQLDSGPRHQYGLHTRDNPPGIERLNPNLEVFQQPGNRLAALFLSAATFSPSDVPKVSSS